MVALSGNIKDAATGMNTRNTEYVKFRVETATCISVGREGTVAFQLRDRNPRQNLWHIHVHVCVGRQTLHNLVFLKNISLYQGQLL